MSERDLQSILDNSTAVIIVKDLGGHYLRVNRQFEEIFGLDRSKVLGKTDHELFPKEVADRFRANDLEVIRAAQPIEFEEIALHQDGPHNYISIKFPLYDDAGVANATAGIFTDITDRKRAEEKLQRNEQLFRSIFENAQIGISFFELDSQEIIPNRTLQEMLGRTEKDLRRLEEWDEITHPDERASCAERYAELVQGKREKDEWEQRLVRKDGRILITSVRFSLLRDAAGKPEYVVALQEDITERRVAEDLVQKRDEELRRANFLAETALELTKAGYWHVPLDGSGWFISSPRRVALFGDTPRSDFRYRLDEMFAQASEGDETAANIAREAFTAAVEGKADKYDVVFAYKRPIDGRITWIHALGRVRKDADGKGTDMYGVSQDITEFKRLEAELLSAKQAAETATKAKSDFLANMSHEIRTPMNAILGMTHLALRTELTTQQRDYLTKTKAAGEALLRIINDILDFSKIEAGKLSMEHTDFRLEVVLENLSTVVSHKAREKNLEFLIDVQHDVPATLIGDTLRLGQVLINLANNAVKFTERGEVVVTVKLEELVSNRVKLRFEVRDSGIGMTPEQTARLFQAFSQADTSTTRKYGGSGLGLSISKQLVAMMEGSIWVESEPGRGTTFCFTAWFGVASPEKRPEEIFPGLAGIRALVVDDNALAQEVLAHTLKQFLPRVDCVSSGDDALRELASSDRQDPFQLVLLDWQMPGLDGLETSRIIKRGGRLKNLPKIVMVTAFGREEIRAQAEEMGVEGFLQKPVSPSVLFDTLMNIFGVASEQSSPSIVSKGGVQSHDARGLRVLLVEDNEVNQQIAMELLQSVGASVTIANHGREAVEILTEGDQPPPFDVVLMDLQMPEMDGFAATRILRAKSQLRNLPIIAMTAHAMTEEIQRCLETGMNDHVAKPIDPGVLFATLGRWTQGQGRNVSDLPVKASPDDGVILPEIEGVDEGSGLQRVAGNRRLYRDLLTQFAEKQSLSSERIATAIQSGDYGLAERLAHSLKGAAGNIGINPIFHLAGRLEAAIREASPGLPALVKEFVAIVDHQVKAIQQALKIPTPPSTARSAAHRPSPAAVSAAVSHLRGLLDASDADAAESYSALAEMLNGTVRAARLESLGAAVKRFHFEAAAIELEGIARELGVDWKKPS